MRQTLGQAGPDRAGRSAIRLVKSTPSPHSCNHRRTGTDSTARVDALRCLVSIAVIRSSDVA